MWIYKSSLTTDFIHLTKLNWVSWRKSTAGDLLHWPREAAVHGSALCESLEFCRPYRIFNFKLRLSQLMKKRGFLCSSGEYSQSLKHFAVCFCDCNCQTKLNRYLKARLLYVKRWMVAGVWEGTALAWGCVTQQHWVSDGARPRRPRWSSQFVLRRAAQQMSFR